ncbi:pyrokinin-1 receptor-like [Argopecten irradians]|uniref:pyrokinin-1 receptor-like n=1 Tax=Argopecten irradians TaxID=31199 RepID=UPI003723C087
MHPAIRLCLGLVKNRTLHIDRTEGPNCKDLFLKHLSNIFNESRYGNASTNTALPEDDGFDVWRYLAQELEPRRDDLPTVISVTLIYCILFCTGVFGNVCTCIVIAKNKFMHTATNYYLFNLAVADLLLLLIGLPPDLYTIWSLYPWIFGEAFCVARVLFAEISTFTSILTITAFTVERYVAICFPMKAQRMSSLYRAVRVIFCTWCLSTICAIPQAIQYGVVYIPDPWNSTLIQSAMCTFKAQEGIKWTFQVSAIIFFAVPMTFITVLYTLIAITIRRSTLSRGSMDSSSKEHLRGVELHAQQQARARRSVLKMLVAVVVAFFLCWAPFHAERLMVIYVSKWTGFLLKIHKKLFYLSGVCYFISGTINPVLYSIMSLKFRQAFKQTLLRLCCRKSTRHRPNHFSYKFVHRNGHTETSYTSVGPIGHGPARRPLSRPLNSRASQLLGDNKPLAHSSGSTSSQKRESLTRSISGSSLKSTDEMCGEEDMQEVLFQIKCYDNNRNTAELVIGVC